MIDVIGLDLSLCCTGIASRTETRSVTSQAAHSLADNCTRLEAMDENVCAAVARMTGPSSPALCLVVIEGLSFASSRPGQDKIWALWWLVVIRLHAMRYPVAVCAPPTLKKYLTGKGNAGKDEVLLAVSRRYPSHSPRDNNEADALGLCAMGCDYRGSPIAVVPAAQRKSLDAVQWPDSQPKPKKAKGKTK